MPIERGPGATSITGNAILGMRGFYAMQGMQMYLESNGKMQLTRVATPTLLRGIATEFTGKKYARSRKGLEQAYEDMKALVLERGNLDALGETAMVNKTVGGVAADLPRQPGTHGGPCYRRACRAPNATWYNRSTLQHYCNDCASILNEAHPALMADGFPLCIQREPMRP